MNPSVTSAPERLLRARSIDQSSRPVYAVWELTLLCDQACRHCGSRASKARPDELNTEEALNLCDQLAELGLKEVTLIGGEVYLRRDWLLIGQRLKSHGINWSVVTGGQGITEKLAEEAMKFGIDRYSVSIDGLPAVHDFIRNKTGSFERAYRALKIAKKVGMTPAVNTSVSRQAVLEMKDLYRLLVDGGLKDWQVQLIGPMGRAADNPDILMHPWQVLEFQEQLHDLQASFRKDKVFLFPGSNIGFFGPYEHELRFYTFNKHTSECHAGRTVMGIEANGAIKGCPSLSTETYSGGTIRDLPLKTIWEQTEPLRFTRDRNVNELWGFCGSCYYKDVRRFRLLT